MRELTHHRAPIQHILRILTIVCLWLVFYALLRPPTIAHAGSFTWTGAGDGSTWTDPSNWNPSNGYPGAEGEDDSATIVRLGGGPANVTLNTSVTLASLSVAEGSTLRGGVVDIKEDFTWSGGRLYNTINVRAGAAMTIQGTDPKTLAKADGGMGMIHNYGDATWRGTGLLTLQTGASIVNTGTFVAEAGTILVGGTCCATNYNTFVNEGLLRVITPFPFPPGQVTFRGAALINSGTVEAVGTTLELEYANHLIHNGSIFTGSGRTRLTGPSADLDGIVTIAAGGTLELASIPSRQGILAGTATINGPGTLLWTGGTLRADLTIARETTMIIRGDADKTLDAGYDGGVLTNDGNVFWENGRLKFDFEPLLVNAGTFTIQSDSVLLANRCCLPPVATFKNAGTLIKSAGTGSSTFQGVGLVNSGVLDIRSGAIDLDNSAHILDQGSVLRGAGRLRVIGPSVDLWGTLAIDAGGTLELAAAPADAATLRGGEIIGAGVITGTGTFLWTGGEIAGAVVIGPQTTLRIDGPDAKVISTGAGTGRLDLLGTGRWAGTGAIRLESGVHGAEFNNRGTFIAESNAAMVGDGSGSQFLNAGAFRHNAAGANNFSGGLVFQNRGTVELSQGALVFDGGAAYLQLGGTTNLAGGTISTTTNIDLRGGSLTGAGTITGTVINKGRIAPGAPLSVLAITGDLVQRADGILDLELGDTAGAAPQAGAAASNLPPVAAPQATNQPLRVFLPLAARAVADVHPGLSDRVIVGGRVTLDGILQLTPLGGIVPPSGATYTLLTYSTRSRTFSHVSGLNAAPPRLRYEPTQMVFDGDAAPRLLLSADARAIAPTVLGRAPYVLNRSVTVVPLQVRVVDHNGAALEGHRLQVSVTADPTSGGHAHGSNPPVRPHGWVLTNPPPAAFPPDNGDSGTTVDRQIAEVRTDANGRVLLYFIAPEFGGLETVRVSSLDQPGLSVDFSLLIKNQDAELDFQLLPGHPAITPIGATAQHADNHYGTEEMIDALVALAVNYDDETGQRLRVNDMSLPWGGLFDIGATPAALWRTPHGGHRWGNQVDIGLVADPPNLVFETMVRDQGRWRVLNEANHYHLVLQDPGQVTVERTVRGVTWESASQRILRVSLQFKNRGSLRIDALHLRELTGSNGVTFVDLSLPVNLGDLGIRGWLSTDVLVQVPAGVRSFSLSPAGVVLADGRTFILPVQGVTVTVPD